MGRKKLSSLVGLKVNDYNSIKASRTNNLSQPAMRSSICSSLTHFVEISRSSIMMSGGLQERSVCRSRSSKEHIDHTHSTCSATVIIIIVSALGEFAMSLIIFTSLPCVMLGHSRERSAHIAIFLITLSCMSDEKYSSSRVREHDEVSQSNVASRVELCKQ